ncbi:phage terminase small subunit [Virgibacillus salarius]|uniref:phage terminase small subunit n=1 Tax=Virgibacillus salarius TaxID=447199 RepID=UPI0024929F83|nr:phage terminase small subunit [Virgibacillus salarius]WBX81303.1 phage terminase small subunit [Virgibacillus salarius]
MAETHKLAEKDYIKGMKYKDIAAKHGVSINTVKSWKRRHGWERNKGAPKEKSVHTKKGGQPDNKNALGNKGGAPQNNSNAVTHGLFAKYLPEETLNIVNDIDSISPLDILWMNIKMQFAQIMRAQQIMHVENKDDLTKELKKSKYEVIPMGEEVKQVPIEEEYELQFAWDKQANFLNSQSRAMGELRSMLKQFYEMAHADDYRLLEIEKIRATIDKTKAESERITKEHTDEELEEIVIVDEWSDNDE